MHLKTVKIRNFMFIEEADLKLGKDLYLVVGENHDDISSSSNGAGKSMFCESLMWCLFGKLIRDNAVKDDVIGQFATHTEVTLELFAAGHIFKVTRYRKHPTLGHKLIVTVDGEEIAKHLQADSQRFLDANLGLCEATAFQTMYSGQDGEESFIKQSPANMLKTIIKIFQLGEIDKFEKGSKAHKVTLRQELDNQQGKVLSNEKQLEILKYNAPSQRQFIDGRFQSNLQSLKEEVLTLQVKADILLESEETSGISKEEEKQMEALSKDINDINKLKNKSLLLSEEISKDKKLIRLAETKLETYEVSIKSNQDILNNLVHNATGECSYCGNDIIHSGFTTSKIDQAQQDIDTAVVESSKYTAKINELKKRLLDKETDRKELDDTLNLAHDMISSWKELTSRKSKHDSILKQISAILSQIETLQEKKIPRLEEEYQLDLKSVDSKLRDYEKQLMTLGLNLEREKGLCDNIENKIKLVDRLVAMCQGIKELRFNNVMCQLKSKIAYNLDTLTGQDTVCVVDTDKDKFRFLFQKRTEISPKMFSQLSKGERAKVQRVIYDSFADILSVPFIIDDEGLDGLDDSGTVAVLDYMSNRNPNTTVLFVAHQQSVKDYFTSRPIVRVVRKNNKCYITVEK